MGRWSRPLAHEFVRWLSIAHGAHWLDVGAGTGALTSAICSSTEPASVVACDPAAPLLASARRRMADARVGFQVAGSGTLPRREGGYDAVVSALVLNFLSDPVAAVREQLSLTRSGGVVAACVWDYSEGMELLRCFWDAAVELDADAKALDEGERFPICRPDRLREIFEGAGARAVRVESLVIPTRFSSFADYWRPFLGGTGPAPSYVSALSEAGRAALRDRLEARLGNRDPDGAVELSARAWAVAGSAP